MDSRNSLLLTAIELLSSGRSVELAGEIGSGRSFFLAQVASHFTSLNWNVLSIAGIPGLSNSPFASLGVSGLVDLDDQSPGSLLSAFRSMTIRFSHQQTLIIVDDSGWLDEMSWSFIHSMSARNAVPVLASRTIHEELELSAHMTGKFSAPHLMRLPGMTFHELEQMLQDSLEETLSSSLSSRVFAKSEGNPGLAQAIIDSARRSGKISVSNGVLLAEGSLWNSGLTSLAKRLLAPLNSVEIQSLRTLSLAGPLTYLEAKKLIPHGDLLRLEYQKYLGINRTCLQSAVAVHPALLVEYFSQVALPDERDHLLKQTGRPTDGHIPSFDADAVDSEAPADLVRLIHEQTRHWVANARHHWKVAPSLASASALLRALGAVLIHDGHEIEALLRQARNLAGSTTEHADWEISVSKYLAFHAHKPQEAIQALTQASRAFPAETVRFEAQQILLSFHFGVVPSSEPFPQNNGEALDGTAQQQVLIARVIWFLARGHAEEAARIFSEKSSEKGSDVSLCALEVYIQLALGNFTQATRYAETKLADAIASVDAVRIKVFSYLVAFIATLTGDDVRTSQALNTATSLGIPAGVTPDISRGISALLIRVTEGTEASETSPPKSTWPTSTNDSEGVLPGQQLAFGRLREAVARGHRPEALDIAVKSGDDLWDRGAFLSAAFMYLEGLQVAPDRLMWERIEPRISQVSAPVIAAWSGFVRKLVMHDVDGLAELMSSTQLGKLPFSTARLAQHVLNVLPKSAGNSDGRSILEEAATQGLKTGSALRVPLSPRELDVARLIAAGVSNPEIAEMMYLSRRTVESHIMQLYKKIGATTRGDIRAYILATGGWAPLSKDSAGRK